MNISSQKDDRQTERLNFTKREPISHEGYAMTMAVRNDDFILSVQRTTCTHQLPIDSSSLRLKLSSGSFVPIEG